MGKKKHTSETKSSDSESNSDSDTDSSTENVKSSNAHKSKKQRSSSYSDDSEHEIKEKERKADKLEKTDSSNDRIRKRRYDEIQKSKWDSPAENISKFNPRRSDDSKGRRHFNNRDDSKPSRKYVDRRNDRQDNMHRNTRDDYKNRDDRFNKDRGRYHRKQNDERYRSDRRRSKERSRSRDDNRRDKRDDGRDRGNKKSRFEKSEGSENYEWGKKSEESKKPPTDKEKPNFGLSGKLTEETNTYRGVVIKYSEPTEARKPKRRWRLYPFKGEKALPTLYIHRESAYLMGRDRKVVDFPLDHPSCSKQHAVLQYRLVPFNRDNGTVGKRVRPYLIDLDSANGTYINNKKIEPRKYVELLEKDVIKFGYSTREYVLLHENSKDEMLDDDVKQEDEELPIKEEPQE